MGVAAERETVVQFDDASDEAVVYTHQVRWQNRLRALAGPPLEDNGHGGLTWRIPKSWVRLPAKPRVASEAQRRSLSAARAAGKEPNG